MSINLDLIKIIGKGSFSSVYLSSNPATNQNYAVKQIVKNNNILFQNYTKNEENILKELNHPNIVKYFETKQDSNYYYFLTEYYNGETLMFNLEEYEKKFKKPFDEKTVQYFMKQIISGIKYLHDKNILHRDINSENILLHYDSEEDKINNNFLNAKIKIVDFVFSKKLTDTELTDYIVGTPIYMDPIVLKNYQNKEDKTVFSKKYDIWSLGILCYEMLNNKEPFYTTNLNDLVKKYENGDYFLPINLSEETISFINAMLQYDRDKRYNIDELFNHEFLNKPISEFTKINPKNYCIVDSKIKMNTKKAVLSEEQIKDQKDITIKMLQEKINILQKEINEKEKTDKQLIKELYQKNEELKKKLELFPFELSEGEKLISVNFTTVDGKIHYSIICKNTDKFNRLEDKFYNDNPKMKKNGNYFTINGEKINNSKTLDDNNIHDNNIIILNQNKV